MRDSDFTFTAAEVPDQDLLGGLAGDPAEDLAADAADAHRAPLLGGGEPARPAHPPRDELGELATKLATSGTTGESSSAAIFDIGKSGLEFFRRFGPPYAEVTGSTFDYQREIAQRYDAQREIAFGKLYRDSERFAAVREGLTDNLVNLRNAADPVFEAWQGAAASSAKAQVDRALDGSGEVPTRLGLLGEVLAVAVRGAERVVLDKAIAVRDLHVERIGPCDAGDVAFLAELGPRIAARDVRDADLNRVARLLEMDIDPAICRRTPEIMDAVGSDVRGWLHNVFVPFFQARQQKFEFACTSAEENLAAAWNGLAEVLDTVRADTERDIKARSEGAADQQPGAEGGSGRDPVLGSARPAVPGAAGGGAPGAAVGGGAGSPGGAAGAPGQSDPVVGAGTTGNQAMSPSSFHASQVAGDAPAEPQRPAGSQGGGQRGGGGFFGAPFLGGAQGGGDQERRRSVPLSGDVFEQSADPRALDIGGADDAAVYNDADQDEQAREEARPLAESLFDDDDDIW